MQIYFAAALSVAALVVWVMALRSSDTSPQSSKTAYTLAPLGAALLVALLTPPSDHLYYKGAIVLGMLLALIAVAMRASGFLPSYVAHAHLVWTYILYGLAFGSLTNGWPSPFAILLLAIAGLLYYWLYPTLAELWSSIAIYGLLMLLAAWQALELALQQPSAWIGWIALAGMILATVATMLEAQARFRSFRPTWANASLPVFALAQLVIAWSIWG